MWLISCAETQGSLDGELSARVFGVLQALDTGLHAQVVAGTQLHISIAVYFK